jgi:hypothetical protein
MVLGRIKWDTRRSGSTDNRLDAIDCNTSRLIRTISINLMLLSFRRLLTQCFTGIGMPLNTTSFCQTFRD